LRGFSLADAHSITAGKLTVTLISADHGHGQNATRNVHTVLELDGETLQPSTKSESNLTLYRWGLGEQTNSTMNGEFTFALPSQHGATGRLVLINYNNKQYFQAIDFSSLR